MRTYSFPKKLLIPSIIGLLLFFFAPILNHLGSLTTQWLLHSSLLTSISLWISNPVFFISLFFCIGHLTLIKHDYHSTLIFLLTVVISSLIAILLKDLLALPRPEALLAYTHEDTFGFPSLHAAMAWSSLALLFIKKHRLMFFYLIVLALLVSISRVILGAHYVTDVLGGVGIALFTSFGVYYVEQKTQWIATFLDLIQKELEVRRQLLHMAFGLVIMGLLWLGMITWFHLLLLLFFGIYLSSMSKKRTVPLITRLLHLFDRPQHLATFPGKGVITYALGALITVILFPLPVALAALGLLAVGDCLTHLVGRYLGKTKLPWNTAKHAEGTLAGIIGSVPLVLLFVPLPVALVSSICIMMLESFPLRIGGFTIDDNLSVPIVGGSLIQFLLHYTSSGVI